MFNKCKSTHMIKTKEFRDIFWSSKATDQCKEMVTMKEQGFLLEGERDVLA